MSAQYAYTLEAATQSVECFCPCPIYRHTVCERVVDVGRPVAVMHDTSGTPLSLRCAPCAVASRLLADTAAPLAATRDGGHQ